MMKIGLIDVDGHAKKKKWEDTLWLTALRSLSQGKDSNV